MVQQLPPNSGKETSELTKIEGVPSKMIEPDTNLKAGELSEHEKAVLKFQYEIDFRNLEKMKKVLKEKGENEGTISINSRELISKAMYLNSANVEVWSSTDFDKQILELFKKGDYLDALAFINKNEQRLVESWVEGFLQRTQYSEASSFLKRYAKTQPFKEMDEDTVNMDEEINAHITGIIDEQLGIKKSNYKPQHERVWSAVHNGYYAQAAEMCSDLNLEMYGGVRGKKDKVPKPFFDKPLFQDQKSGLNKKPADITVVNPKETTTVVPGAMPASRQKHYEAELMEVMATFTLKQMTDIFGNIPNLIQRFHHTVNEYLESPGPNQAHDKLALNTIKEDFRFFVDNLFEEKKILISETGPFSAEEELLTIIDDLAYLDMYLYFDKSEGIDQLHLLTEEEAQDDRKKGRVLYQVDLRKLNADDVVFDYTNFRSIQALKEQAENTHVDEEITDVTTDNEDTQVMPQKFQGEKTLTSVQAPKPAAHLWLVRSVGITPKKARELREAA